MSYRSLERTLERYQLTAMWLLIGAFVVTWAMMFVHPSAAIALFWIALIAVGLFAIVRARLLRAERRAAKTAMKSHLCPRCEAHIDPEPGEGGTWHCTECGATFLESGDLQRAGG